MYVKFLRLESTYLFTVTASAALKMRSNPSAYEDIVFLFPPGNPNSAAATKQPLPMHLKLALIFNAQLPNLFRFGYFARPEDGMSSIPFLACMSPLLILFLSFHAVPEDILDDCIWALSLFIRIMEECTEAALRAMGHVKGNNDYKRSKYLTVRFFFNFLSCLD
jgi:hypothetical protein